MVVMKIDIKMPEYCDDCIYYSCRPHPYKGWSETCQLCMHTMDEEDGEWCYDGNGRPKMCPLMELKEQKGGINESNC